MGNTQSLIKKVNFEDIRFAINNPSHYILLNTMTINQQSCLITNTLNVDEEVDYIDNLLKSRKTDKFIIVYGLNSNDDLAIKKYHQLINLQFIIIYKFCF